MSNVREDVLYNFVHLVHLLREHPKTDFAKELKLVPVSRRRPKLRAFHQRLQLGSQIRVFVGC